VPKPKKAAPVAATSNAPVTTGEKKKGKQVAGGQKSLMSFFGKK